MTNLKLVTEENERMEAHKQSRLMALAEKDAVEEAKLKMLRERYSETGRQITDIHAAREDRNRMRTKILNGDFTIVPPPLDEAERE